MITDDERREVARRLRGISRGVKFWGGVDPLHYVKKGVFGDVDRHGPNETIDRLADLIEPPACPSRAVRAYAEEVDWHTGESPLVHELRGIADRMDRECAPVDRDALLALAGEMDHPIKQAVWNQTAGVRREHVMAEYARRIREAVGVVA